eukprot:TRINITY_DN10384_c0_g3_i1.p1 TRINITY_DN10384_c0_g3~~TRINITY_DN10384_c0_g3_i1.p1  ORF type:complete len:143 (-),score=36.42 TRINITY_DN10384_c0_g3_i1:117-545(-)
MKKVGDPEAMNSQGEIEQKEWVPPASFYDKKKRHRRTAMEIERRYKCKIKGCGKSYGSEGSLSQHMKLKHNKHSNDNQVASPPAPETAEQVKALGNPGLEGEAPPMPNDLQSLNVPAAESEPNLMQPENPPSPPPIESLKQE